MKDDSKDQTAQLRQIIERIAADPNLRQSFLAGLGQHGATQSEASSTGLRGRPLPELMAKTEGLESASLITRNASSVFTDAWAGTYNSAIAEVVIGTDDRIRIMDTAAIPYRWICSLVITAANGSLWLGTGWLAAPRLVITAGHCVYLPSQGGWAAQIDVYPGANGIQRPYSYTSSQFFSTQGWIQQQSHEYDYAALILPLSAASANLGYFGYGTLSDSELAGITVNVVGYPSDKEPGTMWGHTRELASIEPNILRYQIDTYGGQSGAPLIHWDSSDYVVVGIHNYGDYAGNQATRITGDVFQNIQYWKSLI